MLRCLCLFLLLQVSVAVGVVVARVAFLLAVILLDSLLHVVVVVCSSSNSDEDDDNNGEYNSSKPRQLLSGLHTVMRRCGALVGAKKSASGRNHGLRRRLLLFPPDGGRNFLGCEPGRYERCCCLRSQTTTGMVLQEAGLQGMCDCGGQRDLSSSFICAFLVDVRSRTHRSK